MNCKNCEAVVEDTFCAKCGQNINEKRLDLGFFVETFNKKYNPLKMHKSLFSFFLKPKTTITNFLECKRVDVLDPVAVLFLSVGLTILLDGFLKNYIPPKPKTEVDQIKVWIEMQNLYQQHVALFSFLIIVPVSFLSWYFLRKKKSNLAEHIAINTYLNSFSFLLGIIITLINFAEIKLGYSHNFSQILSLFVFIYISYLFSQIIDGSFTFSTTIKYMIANFIFYFLGVTFIILFILSNMNM
jgi:hypothetical protein